MPTSSEPSSNERRASSRLPVDDLRTSPPNDDPSTKELYAMVNKVRLGIVGLGAQGSMYAKFIADGLVPNMEIGAIADTDPAKAAVVDTEYGVPFFTDYLDLLESGV